MSKIKLGMNEHRKAVVIIFAVAILIALIPMILNFFSSVRLGDEEEEQVNTVELTNEQEKIVNDYKTDIKNIYAVLENSKGIDNTGLRAMFIENNQFIERYNGEDIKRTFAICSCDKETIDLTQAKSQFDYHMSILLPDNKYASITFSRINDGKSETSPIFSATLESKDCFKNATKYMRVSNTDNFNITKGEHNADQFFDNKYQEMFTKIKDFCAYNYPQIGNLEGTGEVSINYFNNSVSAIFKMNTQQAYTIVCMYNKTDGSFSIYRGK